MTPSILRLDQAEQALDAVLAWRAIDIQHGTTGDEGWMALMRLRDAADRIQSLNDQIGDVA